MKINYINFPWKETVHGHMEIDFKFNMFVTFIYKFLFPFLAFYSYLFCLC